VGISYQLCTTLPCHTTLQAAPKIKTMKNKLWNTNKRKRRSSIQYYWTHGRSTACLTGHLSVSAHVELRSHHVTVRWASIISFRKRWIWFATDGCTISQNSTQLLQCCTKVEN